MLDFVLGHQTVVVDTKVYQLFFTGIIHHLGITQGGFLLTQ
jgi:hypothetical protein